MQRMNKFFNKFGCPYFLITVALILINNKFVNLVKISFFYELLNGTTINIFNIL